MFSWKKLIFVGTLSVALSGCVAVGAAAVGAAAAAVIYNRQNIKASMDDESISYAIEKRINDDEELKTEARIIVSTYHRMVLLAGQTPTNAMRSRAVTIAKSVPGSEQIYNELSVEAPSSTLENTSDSWITAKIKADFLSKVDLKSGEFKVITDNGIVYLMGIVTRDQADQAVDVARHVTGVEKVVKIFKYRAPYPEEEIVPLTPSKKST